jgi:hypothetical protein
MAKQPKQNLRTQVKKDLGASMARTDEAGRLVSDMVLDMVQGELTAPVAPKRRRLGEKAGTASRGLAAQTPAPLGLAADATDELARGGQAFGDVLKAIGHAVVVSQAALDDAAIESAKMLSQTKLKVTVAVRQELNDSGDIPDGVGPQLDERTLSLSNFILPTLHQWQHVAISMDLTVGEIDATSGLKVKTGGVSVGASVGAGGFSAAGEFNYSSLNAESRFRSDFSEGSVRFDALLGPREEFRFPEIADFAIGPQILVTQDAAAAPAKPAVLAQPPIPAVGSTPAVPAVPASPAVPAFRKVTLTVKMMKQTGAALTGKDIDIRIPPELRRRLTGLIPGGLKPTSAPIVLDLNPDFASDPLQSFRIQLKYGDLTKFVDVTM